MSSKQAKKRYVVGIDVGLNSTGLAAIEVDENRFPLRLLNCQTNIHDGGVDPNSNKSGESRLAVSGVARRTRRMRNRRRKRLQRLDDLLSKAGYPLVDTNDLNSAFEPWMVRAELVDGFIEDEAERKQKIAIAVRHMARHRGWRNPYHKWESLFDSPTYSEHYEKLLDNVQKAADKLNLSGLTPAQLVREAIDASSCPDALRLRTAANKGKKGVLPVRLFQQDNAKELLQIFATQRIAEAEWKPLFAVVFEAKSPKGSAERRVGRDPLDPKEKRALKASLAFQKYRIMNILTNLRIDRTDGPQVLTVEERQLVFETLCEAWGTDDHSWADIADVLGLNRSQLKGVGSKTNDGEERITSRPPTLTSFTRIYEFSSSGESKKKKLGKSLLAWFGQVDEADQEVMIKLLSNTVDIDAVRDEEQFARALEWIDELDEDQLGDLDKIVLPAGRAAYSEKTLRKLTERMLTTEDDLHEARKAVFNVDDNWRPPMDPVGEPIGNPAVDRVLKIVNRYLLNCQARWGAPVTVQIEHVRDGFSSVKSQRKNASEYERMLGKRTELRKSLQEKLLAEGYGQTRDESAIRKIEAIQRQNSQCLYCGRELSFHTAEMDHIVPRAGAGSTNTRTNLMAVCGECNRSKTNWPFAVWCNTPQAIERGVSLSEAVKRVNNFLFEGNVYNSKQQKHFKQQVILRLKRTDADPKIDNRSIESTAWMADELHRRIDWYFNRGKYSSDVAEDESTTKVWVFKGAVTAAARRASGIEKQIHFIGGSKKTRFDRRHHAVDAAVIALMSHGVARTLEVREQLRLSQRFVLPRADELCWKDYPTEAMSNTYRTFHDWKQRMYRLLELLNDALDNDRIPVLQNMRARLGNSLAHEETIHQLVRLPLGAPMNPDLIKRSSTPALYCALTRLPDYDAQNGLPADPMRTISVHGRFIHSGDSVEFFKNKPKKKTSEQDELGIGPAQIKVGFGAAELGAAFHHARIYRCIQTLKSGKQKPFYGMIRVYAADLRGYRQQDLFTAPLPPQTVSMRWAEPRVVEAIASGNAEYLGYLIPGDELILDPQSLPTTAAFSILYNFVVEELEAPEFSVLHWRVDGFYTDSRLRLRPFLLSQEGLDKIGDTEVPDEVSKIFTKGYCPAVSSIFGANSTVIRRNAFGEVRWRSKSGLPVSWRWVEDSHVVQ